jgi:hypothetical protein
MTNDPIRDLSYAITNAIRSFRAHRLRKRLFKLMYMDSSTAGFPLSQLMNNLKCDDASLLAFVLAGCVKDGSLASTILVYLPQSRLTVEFSKLEDIPDVIQGENVALGLTSVFWHRPQTPGANYSISYTVNFDL